MKSEMAAEAFLSFVCRLGNQARSGQHVPEFKNFAILHWKFFKNFLEIMDIGKSFAEFFFLPHYADVFLHGFLQLPAELRDIFSFTR